MAWTLDEIEKEAGKPIHEQELVAKHALRISRYIEESPNDIISILFESRFGRVYNIFLQNCCKEDLGREVAERKEELSQQLRLTGIESEDGFRVLLSLMPLYPPAAMKVEKAESKLPKWLYEIYKHRYEPYNIDANNQENEIDEEKSDFNNRIFLNKILGLSNLYYIDPEDVEIRDELKRIRLECIELIIKTDEKKLADEFHGDFGDRYWAMAQSGIQKEALDILEEQKRNEIQQWLMKVPNSLHAEGGIQRFACALLFNPSGSVQISNPEKNLPSWFQEGFKRYSATSM